MNAKKKERLIFSVTTGRSGTKYLDRIFQGHPHIYTCHEAQPNFANIMRAGQNEPELLRKFWLEKKLPQIRKHLENSGKSIYLETSHLFCKGFLEPLIDLGIVPDLILLVRPHQDVAKSLFQLGCIPGRTDAGLRFCVAPNDPGVLPLKDFELLHDYHTICDN